MKQVTDSRLDLPFRACEAKINTGNKKNVAVVMDIVDELRGNARVLGIPDDQLIEDVRKRLDKMTLKPHQMPWNRRFRS